jgi:hypothetical protein
MDRFRCKYCKWFRGELMTGAGEVLDERGVCVCKTRSRKATDFDDYCNAFATAKWAEKKEGK